ncbi:DUF721 domain-containing protein [Pectinatus cerevisiiphilus]|uniref:Uncharacterized protein DUF721 n=1 Tax=Pectinatus cerevisiiphilus TaxID=86956 RepID=A0A4R3KF38_9FIRM|nr:DUF721 domain-containing protein [Pectinatus cerevisiiphilus]TCS81878.1 uncharacterized protein DUF721 [Pectinatus cerevisiiphilus]
MLKRKWKNTNFATVGEIMPRALKHLTKSPEYKLYLIKFYWESIVGKEIAEHAIPKNFAFGVLYIGTSSSVWANNLLYMKFDIIDKINNALKYKLIKDIHFTYGKKGSNKIIPTRIKDKRDIKRILANTELLPQEISAIESSCGKLEDKDLAASMKKILIINEKINKVKKKNKWHNCKNCNTLCPEDEIYCDICKRKLKNGRYAQIRKILLTKPWARYGEIKEYIEGCSAEMVNAARTDLVQRMTANLQITSYDDIQLQTLVMLYRALPPEQINRKTVKENINRLKYDLIYNEMKKLMKKEEEN